MAGRPVRSRETYPDVYYDCVVDPGQGHVEGLLDQYSLPERSALARSIALHNFVYRRVDSRDRTGDDPLRRFGEVLDHGGNCEEKSILLASLLSRVEGVGVRFVTIERQSVGHALLEIHVPHGDRDRQADRMRTLYDRTPEIGVSPQRISWEGYGGDDWLLADPEYSRYLGDLQPLIDDGYARLTQNGESWEWTRVKEQGHGV
jgi:hypothetical protein